MKYKRGHFLRPRCLASCLESAGLCERLVSRRVGDGVCVSSHGMRGCISAALRRKRITPRRKSLAGIQREGIGHGRTRAAVCLRDLSSDCVVLAAETHSRSPLHDNRDRQRRQGSGVRYA